MFIRIRRIQQLKLTLRSDLKGLRLLVLYENFLIGFESDELFLGTMKTYKIINFVCLSWKKSDLYLSGVELETHILIWTHSKLWPKSFRLKLKTYDFLQRTKASRKSQFVNDWRSNCKNSQCNKKVKYLQDHLKYLFIFVKWFLYHFYHLISYCNN